MKIRERESFAVDSSKVRNSGPYRHSDVLIQDVFEHFLSAALDFGFAVFEGVGFEVVKAGLAVFDFGAQAAVPAGGEMSCVGRRLAGLFSSYRRGLIRAIVCVPPVGKGSARQLVVKDVRAQIDAAGPFHGAALRVDAHAVEKRRVGPIAENTGCHDVGKVDVPLGTVGKANVQDVIPRRFGVDDPCHPLILA